MNIHEHQAKKLLKKFGVPVPNGVVAFSVEEVIKKVKIAQNQQIRFKSPNTCGRQR